MILVTDDDTTTTTTTMTRTTVCHIVHPIVDVMVFTFVIVIHTLAQLLTPSPSPPPPPAAWPYSAPLRLLVTLVTCSFVRLFVQFVYSLTLACIYDDNDDNNNK